MQSATLASPVEITGRGLFSGEPCRARIEPAPLCSGLTIACGGRPVPLTIEHVTEKPSCTVINADGLGIAVVEHLLAALWAAGIDTASIQVTGPEIPNQDGSSMPIYFALDNAGRISTGLRPRLEFDSTLRIDEDGNYLQIEPADSLSVDYSFSHPELGEQRYMAQLSREMASTEILPARSFITDKEAAVATAAGILRNDNIDDALVLHVVDGEFQPASPLRFADEFARHKVLDMLGDLYLVPFEWSGKITAYRSGHRLNRAMARKLLELFRS